MKPHLPFILISLITLHSATGADIDLNGGTRTNATLNATDNKLTNSSTTAGTLNGTLTLESNAQIGGTGNITLTGSIQGAHTLTKVDSNTVTLTSAQNAMNTGTAPTEFIISAGQVTFGINNVFGGNKNSSAVGLTAITINNGATLHSTRFNIIGNLTMNGGTLSQDSSDQSNWYGWEFLGNVNVTENATISSSSNKINSMGKGAHTFNVSANKKLTMTAGLRDGSEDNPGSASFIKDGAGTILISNKATSYTFSGGTVIKQGTLQLGNGSADSAATWNFGSGGITIENGATLSLHLSANGITTMNNNFTLKEGSRVYIEDGRYAIQNVAVSGGTSGATIEMKWDKYFNIKGILSGDGLLKFTSSGTESTTQMRSLILENNANTFSGTIQMNATGSQNTLELKANNAAALATVSLQGSASNKTAILNVNTDNASIAGLQGNQHSKIVSTGSNRTLTVNGGGTFAGSLSGNFSLVKTGTSKLTLSGDNTSSFTGAVSIQNGILELTNKSALGSWTRLNIGSAGNLQISLAGAESFVVGAGQTLSMAENGGSITGNISLNTGGTIALGGTGSTVTGNLTLNGGTVDWTLGSTPTASALLTLTGGSLSAATTSTFNFTLSDKVLNNGLYWLASIGDHTSLDLSKITLSGLFQGGRQSYTLTNNGTSDNIYLQVSGEALNLSWVQGSGTWSAAEGNKPWHDGTGSNFFAAGDLVTFGNVSGSTDSIITLDGVLSPGKVTISSSGTNYTFEGTGSIAGASLLVKEGDADLTIKNANTYSDGTQIKKGRIIVQNSAALGSGDVSIEQPATLQLDSAISNNLTGNGGLTINWGLGTEAAIKGSFSGEITLTSGALLAGTSITNAIGFNGGTLKLSSGGTLNTTLKSLAGNTINIDQNGQSLTLGGTISGNVNITGAGNLAFNLSSSYADTVTVQDSGKTIYIENGSGAYHNLGQASLVLGDNTTLTFRGAGVNWTNSNKSITLGADSKIRIENPGGGTLNIYNNFILNGKTSGTIYFDGSTMGNNGTYFGNISGQGNLVIRNGLDGRANGYSFKNGWISNSYEGITTISKNVSFTVDNNVSTEGKHITPFGTYAESNGNITSGIGILDANIIFNLSGNTGTGTTWLDNAIQFEGSNTLNLSDMGTLHMTKGLHVKGNATLNYNPTTPASSLIIDGSLSGTGDLTISGNAGTALNAVLAGTNANYSGNVVLGSASKEVDLEVSGENALGNGGVNLAHADSSVSFTNNQIVTGKITGSGSVTIHAGSNKTVSLNNTQNDYSGTTTIKSGTAVAGSASAFGSGAISVSGGILDANNKALANSISISSGTISKLGAAGAHKSINVTSLAGSIFIDQSFISVANMNTAANQTINLGNGSDMIVSGNSIFTVSAENITDSFAQRGDTVFSISGNSSLHLGGDITLNFESDAFSTWQTAGCTLSINLFELALGSLDLNSLNSIIFKSAGLDNAWLTLSQEDHASMFEQLKNTGSVDITFDGIPPIGARPPGSIPEPSSVGLALMGVAGLLLRRKRR